MTTFAEDIREARSAMRSGYTLLRCELPFDWAHELIDGLEKNHEQLMDLVPMAKAALDAQDMRIAVMRRAAELMPVVERHLTAVPEPQSIRAELVPDGAAS